MLINEVSKMTNLTKKAIEYYVSQGLVSPVVLENSYRDFSDEHVEILMKISVLRRLDMSISEIRHILSDLTNCTLQKLCVKKEVEKNYEMHKKVLLNKLVVSMSYEEINKELQSLEKNKTISDKLLSAFPDFYGRFICMHFSRFLNQPISNNTQQRAYETIISFLDNIPNISIPEDVEQYIIDGTKHLGVNEISEMIEYTKKSCENPDEYLKSHEKMLNSYLEYTKSEEYKNSKAYKFQEIIEEFKNSIGYNDVFIKAMKELSPSYLKYSNEMEVLQHKFLKYKEKALD